MNDLKLTENQGEVINMLTKNNSVIKVCKNLTRLDVVVLEEYKSGRFTIKNAVKLNPKILEELRELELLKFKYYCRANKVIHSYSLNPSLKSQIEKL